MDLGKVNKSRKRRIEKLIAEYAKLTSEKPLGFDDEELSEADPKAFEYALRTSVEQMRSSRERRKKEAYPEG